jgi:hypothetical protein
MKWINKTEKVIISGAAPTYRSTAFGRYRRIHASHRNMLMAAAQLGRFRPRTSFTVRFH